MNVRDFVNQLGGQVEALDSRIFDLEVKQTKFPTEDQQDAGTFLIIDTQEEVQVLIRLDEAPQHEWLKGLDSHLRFGGGSRNSWTVLRGECPKRRLILVRRRLHDSQPHS
jgi:hypothetical protein